MPFFGGRHDPSPEPVYEPEPPRKQGGFFNRRSFVSPDRYNNRYSDDYNQPPTRKHSLFHRNDVSSSPRRASTNRSSLSSNERRSLDSSNRRHHSQQQQRHHSQKKGNFLQRSFGNGNSREGDLDPSIAQARQRVMDAEAAEASADRALEEARLMVREAREDVKRLEEEAKEDARRAKIKQHHAKEVSKMGKALGRHGV